MKISIAKTTIKTVAQRMIPAAISLANVTREINSFKPGFTCTVPSNDQIITALTDLDMTGNLFESKGVNLNCTADEVVLGVNDNYITTVAGCVSDFYGAIAPQLLAVGKALVPVCFTVEKFVQDSKGIDAEWLETTEQAKARLESIRKDLKDQEGKSDEQSNIA